tara:strand:+ start:564 stop:752 length:189 start_codon:yes stop_codon:yes gene_type:complete
MLQPTIKELALRINEEGRWKAIHVPETGQKQMMFEPPPWFKLLDVEKQAQVLALVAEAINCM